MRILLIGGSGFLGFHLVNFLEKSGHKVTIFDKRVGHFKNKRKKIILGDVNNYKKLSSVIRNKDIVYNFAAISDIGESMINPIQTAKINILGNVSILDLCVKYRVKKFIFASTISVYGEKYHHNIYYEDSEKNPFSPYAVTKLETEEYLLEHFSDKSWMLRLAPVYAPYFQLNIIIRRY